jgi:N-carbamoyl-L-amino-acid hydrolase
VLPRVPPAIRLLTCLAGAGHDAQQMAHIVPIGMVFVPSRGGVSHSPLEYTAPEEAANGVEVLYRTVLSLDSRLHRAP